MTFKFKFQFILPHTTNSACQEESIQQFFNENILNCGSSFNPKEPHGTPSNKQIKGVIDKFITLDTPGDPLVFRRHH